MPVLGVLVLQKGPLHHSFIERLRYIELLSRKRVLFRVIHRAGEGHGQRNKVLDLFGVYMFFGKIQGQLKGVL